MAINYTYPVKAVPTVSDNVLIIDNEDTTNPRSTKTATIQSIVNLASGGGGGATWGSITGTLSTQTDLQSALDAKQDTLTLTTTGSSGAATLVGSTLNIPEYAGGGGVSSVTGTAPVVSSGGTTPDISMAAATTLEGGYLTRIDWNTFNNKLTTVSGDLTPVLSGNLDVNGNSIVSTGGLDIRITPDATGNVVLDGIKYPQADGTGGQVLQTNGAGQLSFATVGGGGTPGGSTTEVQFNNAGAFGGDAGLTYDKTNDILTVTGNYEGDINGALLQKVYNNTSGILSKGDVVYLPGGNNGDNPYADLARADSIVTMPALGIVRNDITPTSIGEVVTSGELTGLGSLLSGFTTGDTLYVSTSVDGGLQNTKPASEANSIQAIGKVIKGGVGGALTVLGAFRVNATPNLDSAKIFVGSSANHSASVAMSGDVTIDNTGATTVATINSVAVATVTAGAALGATALPLAGGEMTGAITGNQDITGKRPIVTDTTTNIDLTLGIHEGTFIYSDSALAVTVNILLNTAQAFPVGTEIDLIQAGLGQVTITPAGSVNLNGANAGIPITAQWGGVTLKQITVDNWIIVGKI